MVNKSSKRLYYETFGREYRDNEHNESEVYKLLAGWEYEDAKKLAAETGVDFDKVVRQYKEDEKDLESTDRDLRHTQGEN